MFVTNECFLGIVAMILVNSVLQLCFDDVCWPEDTVNVAVVRACVPQSLGCYDNMIQNFRPGIYVFGYGMHDSLVSV